MSFDADAVWKKGEKTIRGAWSYHWASDSYLIRLKGRDPVTGLQRPPFVVHGEEPEFSGWRLVKPKEKK